MKKQFDEYFLGLDVGTNSVGWAVTDENYNIQKINGKSMWGVELFEQANTAEKTRLFRSNARRKQRQKQRILLLQELFAEEINKIDPSFFIRLKESKLYFEDKTTECKYTLFNDKNLTDKDYYKKYPTVYHLQKELIESNNIYDVRLVYLAIHHILKHRGHFLFEGQEFETLPSISETLKELLLYVNNEFETHLECNDFEKVSQVLTDKQLKNKKKLLSEMINASTKQEKAIVLALLGYKFKVNELYNDDSIAESFEKSISFNDATYEETFIELEKLTYDQAYLIEKIKAIYDWTILAEILGENKYLSFAKVQSYEKHKKDLKILKSVINRYRQDNYANIFISKEKVCKYDELVGKGEKSCSYEDFYKLINSILKDVNEPGDEELEYIKNEIENKTLLPMQVIKDNGVIPYQLHLSELNIILDNASCYLDFLNSKDQSGLTTKEKIIEIFKFRIPYYVGPLNDYHKGKGKDNCWIVKKSSDKIYPWNFEKVVDIQKSAEEFITRMTNKCTYLIGADVIPKNSLLYSEFMVLNELNNLKIDGRKLDVDIKNRIYKDLFKTRTKVTKKLLINYLITENVADKRSEITGIDGDFKSSLISYIEIKKVINEKIHNRDMVEEIIRNIVIFGNAKNLLKQRLKQRFGQILSDEEIKDLSNKKYSGWGSLSREFLQDIIGTNKQTGESYSIIEALRKTDFNMMQLLSSNFTFADQVEVYNKKFSDSETYDLKEDLKYEILNDLYVSPSVKRMIWKTLGIVKELYEITQKQPSKIFIEMARGSEEKKRTDSRKKKLQDLYNKCKEESTIKVSDIENVDEAKLRSDRLYLYYTQMGKCMYSGESIDISNLYNKNMYDIDHIYPRSKIKDDSLDNRVLVKSILNRDKSDSLRISETIQNKQRSFWNKLLDIGFISQKKYERLTRNDDFKPQELSDFIARQIVETRQSTKVIADLLNKYLPNSEIVYVKAGNVSEFRQKFDLLKVREINDHHHAKDAYLNIIVGNVYNTKFTRNPNNYIKDVNAREYNLKKMYDFKVERSGKVAWLVGDNGTIKTVKKYMSKNNILVTKSAFQRKGQLFDQTIVKKGKGQVEIKANLPINKYGGYNKPSIAYYTLVEYSKGKNKIRSIEAVPIYIAAKIGSNPQALSNYILANSEDKKKDLSIRISKIKINTLFNINGFYMNLCAKQGEQLVFSGAVQLCMTKDDSDYIKCIMKYIARNSERKDKGTLLPIDLVNGNDDKRMISKERNEQLYRVLLDKLKSTIYSKRPAAQVAVIEKGLSKFTGLKVEEQCVVLNEMIQLFQCKQNSVDLKLIGGGGQVGKIALTKNISNFEKVNIIYQSPTGIFEKEVDLLTV